MELPAHGINTKQENTFLDEGSCLATSRSSRFAKKFRNVLAFLSRFAIWLVLMRGQMDVCNFGQTGAAGRYAELTAAIGIGVFSSTVNVCQQAKKHICHNVELFL